MATPNATAPGLPQWLEASKESASRARVTQLDIARAAGVHNTTVSLALRNSPTIPETTRRRIQALADEMGYSPDPALRALNAYRNGRRPHEKIDTIGFITNWKTKLEWQDISAYAQYYNGAVRKASQLGFQLEHFWLGEPGMNAERLSNVFYHRRINGAIFAPHPLEELATHLSWRKLCVVKIGRYPRSLGVHGATEDHEGAIRLAVGAVRERGYQRVGFVVSDRDDELSSGAWTTPFLDAQRKWPFIDRVPVLRQMAEPGSTERSFSTAQLHVFQQWLRRYSPDVVIGFSQSVVEALWQLNYSVPEDIGFLDLSLSEGRAASSGVRQNCEHVGAIAVEKLVGLMQQNLSGVPLVSTTTMVEPSWVEGASLPLRESSASALRAM